MSTYACPQITIVTLDDLIVILNFNWAEHSKNIHQIFYLIFMLSMFYDVYVFCFYIFRWRIQK